MSDETRKDNTFEIARASDEELEAKVMEKAQRLYDIQEELEDQVEAFVIAWAATKGMRVASSAETCGDKEIRIFDKDDKDDPKNSCMPALYVDIGLLNC